MELLTGIWIAVGILSCFLLRETFKPRDQKWRLSGLRYKLPPGPKGTPIVGNLFQFLNARRPGGFVPYVSFDHCNMEKRYTNICVSFLQCVSMEK